MGFKLETTDMDLGDTPIENIFLNDFMPMANGTYVKVYLLGYKYAHDRDSRLELTNQSVARHLDIPLEDVLRAWDFWENKGIIQKSGDDEVNYEIKFLSLKQLYIKNNLMGKAPAPKKEEAKSSLADNLAKALKNPITNSMFNSIDRIMRRQTQAIEKGKILDWISDYNMDPDVIEKAFYYSFEIKGKDRRNTNYVEGILRNWYDMGLTTIESVEEYLSKDDEKYSRYYKVMKAVGLSNKGMNDGDMKLISKWFDEYKYPMEMILKGCEASSKVQYPTINYIDGVISDWYKKGIKTPEDIEVMDKPPEKPAAKQEAQRPRKQTSYKTKFHNFEQRTAKYSAVELEDMARRKRDTYRLKGKDEADE